MIASVSLYYPPTGFSRYQHVICLDEGRAASLVMVFAAPWQQRRNRN
jgi:hypothetical protein